MYQMSGTKPNGNELYELHSFFLIGNRNFIEIDEFIFLGNRNFIEIDEHRIHDNKHSEMKQIHITQELKFANCRKSEMEIH